MTMRVFKTPSSHIVLFIILFQLFFFFTVKAIFCFCARLTQATRWQQSLLSTEAGGCLDVFKLIIMSTMGTNENRNCFS